MRWEDKHENDLQDTCTLIVGKAEAGLVLFPFSLMLQSESRQREKKEKKKKKKKKKEWRNWNSLSGGELYFSVT